MRVCVPSCHCDSFRRVSRLVFSEKTKSIQGSRRVIIGVLIYESMYKCMDGCMLVVASGRWRDNQIKRFCHSGVLFISCLFIVHYWHDSTTRKNINDWNFHVGQRLRNPLRYSKRISIIYNWQKHINFHRNQSGCTTVDQSVSGATNVELFASFDRVGCYPSPVRQNDNYSRITTSGLTEISKSFIM